MEIGIEIKAYARSFSEKRQIINRLIRDGVVKCTVCGKPATHVHWQDQEEWYEHCEDHRDYGDQWTGSTRGSYPRWVGVTAVPDRVEAWYAALPDSEKEEFTLGQYDATNYYALMFDDLRSVDHVLKGTKDRGVTARVYPLTNGEFAFRLDYCNYSESGSGFGYSEAIRGSYPTEAAALAAAKEEMHLTR